MTDTPVSTALFARPISRSDFIALFGGLYEHSPWVAEAVWPGIERGDISAATALIDAMQTAVDVSPDEIKLALIRAHPELAGRAAIAGDLTEDSRSEQSGAGLDQCTPDEFESFQTLNADYNARFAFPFIIAVRGLTRHDILKAFETRLENTLEAERQTAMTQIHKIARLRFEQLDPALFA